MISRVEAPEGSSNPFVHRLPLSSTKLQGQIYKYSNTSQDRPSTNKDVSTVHDLAITTKVDVCCGTS